MADYRVVARTTEIPEGGMKPVSLDDKRLMVCHTLGQFYVIDNTCSHDDGTLTDGFLDGIAIECPRHGARFDVTNGKVLCLPAAVPIRSYPVKVEGDQVLAAI